MFNWVQHAKDGNPVTDIGQIDALSLVQLNRLVKVGVLMKLRDLSFPLPKAVYSRSDKPAPLNCLDW